MKALTGALLAGALSAVGWAGPAFGQATPGIQAPEPAAVVIVFSWDRVDLNPEMQARLDTAVAAYLRSQPVTVTLTAPRDPDRTMHCCVGPSQRRANAVREYLIGAGVQPADISAVAFADEPRPVHARIVINFGPGSGW